jgi:hypothetical protein
LATDTSANADELVNDSQFLAYRFNFDTETISFLPVEGDEIRQVASLSRGYFDAGRKLVEIPLNALIDNVNLPHQAFANQPPRFIFHTAFCGSTFLSRCLDKKGVSVSLREPQLLLDAANAKRLHWRSRTSDLDFRDLPKLFLLLLQKHASATESLIIKPINSVNNIVAELLQATNSSRSLMLYTDARNFVLSSLKKGEGGKQTVRSMFDLLRCDFAHLSGLQLTQVIHMTDLRVIMTLWRLQLEQAEQVLRQFSPGGAMASLYAEDLIRNPLESIRAVNDFLGLGMSAAQIEAVVNSDERRVDAKNDRDIFTVEKREQTYRQLENFYGNDLDDGLEWLIRNNPGTALHPELSGALMNQANCASSA